MMIFKYHLTVIIILFLDFIFGFLPGKEKKDIALLKLDAIGDYVLFRNFIDEIKERKITLIGNECWRELSLTLDKQNIENFLFLDNNQLFKDFFYTIKILYRLSRYNFKELIHSTYSRTPKTDLLIKFIRSKNKVGFDGDISNIKQKIKNKTDRHYSRLIKSDKKYLFEFNRNKEFFEKFLGKKLDAKLSIEPFGFKKIFNFNYFVVVPGAGSKKRMWSTENFSKLIDYLTGKYNTKAVLTGAFGEAYLGEEIISKSKNKNNIVNEIGKIKLIELVPIITNCDFLVSNETGAVHIAAALRKKTVCISNGNHFGRFNPYPQEITDKIKYIYPPEIMNSSYEKNIEKYYYGSELEINKIGLKDVLTLF
jgi:ADP-heptose:LPS heptosyltransferase